MADDSDDLTIAYFAGAESRTPEIRALTARVAELEEALGELVRLKDLKDNVSCPNPQRSIEWADYQRLAPAAWAAARAALSGKERS